MKNKNINYTFNKQHNMALLFEWYYYIPFVYVLVVLGFLPFTTVGLP